MHIDSICEKIADKKLYLLVILTTAAIDNGLQTKHQDMTVFL